MCEAHNQTRSLQSNTGCDVICVRSKSSQTQLLCTESIIVHGIGSIILAKKFILINKPLCAETTTHVIKVNHWFFAVQCIKKEEDLIAMYQG